jgi:hypothetical protein
MGICTRSIFAGEMAVNNWLFKFTVQSIVKTKKCDKCITMDTY